jgi:hypothetical protein
MLQAWRGNRTARDSPRAESVIKTKYTALPPSQFFSNESAKNDVEAAGPSARAIDTVVWAIPLTLPSDCLLGTEVVTNIKIAPERDG